MDGLSWSTTRPPESFSRSKSSTDTLSRLASFIARADAKQQRQQRPRTAHLSAFTCPECDRDFSHAADLLQHQELIHTLPKPHHCSSCGRAFSLRSSLLLHKCGRGPSVCQGCQGDSRLSSSCPSCTSRTADSSRHQDKLPHLQPCLLDNSLYACALCGRGFTHKQALLQHQQAGCSELPSASGVPQAGSLPEKSPAASEGGSTRSEGSNSAGLSSRSFRSELGLQLYQQTSHAEARLMRPKTLQTSGGGSAGGEIRANGDRIKRSKSKTKFLSCRSCDLVFRNASKLHVHRKEKHSREKNILTEARPAFIRLRKPGVYPCPTCGKVFLHHLSLRAHHKRHAEQNCTARGEGREPEQSSTKDSEMPEKKTQRPNTDRTNLEEEEEEQGEHEEKEQEQETVGARSGSNRKELEVQRTVIEAERREVPEEEEVEEDGEDEEEEELEFPCPSCAEVFSAPSQLREHVELHESSVQRRRCSVCMHNMDTRTWPRSKRHRLYHCIPCQQGFSALDAFLQHCQEHLRLRVEEDRLTEGYAPPPSKAGGAA